MKPKIKAFWPRTLAAQLIVVTAAAVLVSNIGIAIWFTVTHESLTESALMERLLDRAASAATLLAGIPHREREAAVQTMSSGPWHFTLHEGAPITHKSIPMDSEELALAARVRSMLPENRQNEAVSVHLLDPKHHPEIKPPPGLHRRYGSILEITLPVVRGTELITRFFQPPQPGLPFQFFLAALVAIVTASATAAFAAMRVARPLSKLEAAAMEVARGGDAPRVPEEGPDDVRHAAEAFNAMTDQVQRTLDSQRQLLSAVGHDLRTPITAMRINIEFIEDSEVRDRLEKILEELQSLTEAVLSAARGTGGEKSRKIDLAALIESVCADLEEMGKPVHWQGHAPMPAICRPNEIRRAVRNLIENAVSYGTAANVRLEEADGGISVVVEDEGPGIPEADRVRVFEPFVRLESSRSPETGGVGLGLTLVKAIAEGHGGSIALENRGNAPASGPPSICRGWPRLHKLPPCNSGPFPSTRRRAPSSPMPCARPGAPSRRDGCCPHRTYRPWRPQASRPWWWHGWRPRTSPKTRRQAVWPRNAPVAARRLPLPSPAAPICTQGRPGWP